MLSRWLSWFLKKKSEEENDPHLEGCPGLRAGQGIGDLPEHARRLDPAEGSIKLEALQIRSAVGEDDQCILLLVVKPVCDPRQPHRKRHNRWCYQDRCSPSQTYLGRRPIRPTRPWGTRLARRMPYARDMSTLFLVDSRDELTRGSRRGRHPEDQPSSA